VESAVAHITNFSIDRRALVSSQEMSLRQAQRIRSSGRVQLENLMASMQGPLNLVRMPS
jgi:hypothetical protein